MGIKSRKTRIEMRLNHRGTENTENTEILGSRRVAQLTLTDERIRIPILRIFSVLSVALWFKAVRLRPLP